MTKVNHILSSFTLSIKLAIVKAFNLMDKVHQQTFCLTFAPNINHMAERNAKGQFEEGHEKSGGKQKGYEAPVKKEFRELMADYSREHYETFCRAMMECDPKDFCRYYLEALKFNLPMLQSVTLENTKGITNALTDKLRNLAMGKE